MFGDKDLFARNLEKYLDMKGMTRTRLAEGLNVSPSTVSLWTQAKCFPKPYQLDALCKFLNCSIEDLTGKSEETNSPAITSEEFMALELYRELDDDTKKLVTSLMLSSIKLKGVKK